MHKYYQVILLGTPYRQEELEQCLPTDLGIEIIDKAEINDDFPVLYIYYCKSSNDRVNTSGIDLKDMAEKGFVLPIIKDVKNFSIFIPTELDKINAMPISDYEPIDKLINYILEFFEFQKGNRKVFISYKRNDSEALAIQLFNELSKAHFKPFLDTATIPFGVNFQNNLKDDLTDCELFLILNTSHYEDSKNTQEEIEVANMLSIGTVQVIFGSKEPLKGSELALSINVGIQLEKDSIYPITIIEYITNSLESYRAKGLRIRKDALIKEFKYKYNIHNLEQKSNRILVDHTNKMIYEPILQVPHSSNLQELVDNQSQYPDIKDYGAIIFYNGQYCLNSVNKHMDWLNNISGIPAKSINIGKS